MEEIRTWNDQSFSYNDVSDIPFVSEGLRTCFEYRHLGIREATNGRYGAHVFRSVPGRQRTDCWHRHELSFQMLYVLRGWIVLEYEHHSEKVLRAGTCVLQPPGIRHRSRGHSDDLEVLEICSPAEVGTIKVD